MRARSVIITVLLILSLTLVAQNTQVVSFRLWFWDLTMSRVLLLAGSLAVGVIIGLLLGRPWKRRRMDRKQVPETPAVEE
ncbi:MAG: LapA family protein [Candidatus Bipolaricaulota bacterium]